MSTLALSACWSLVRGRASGFPAAVWPVVFQRCVMERCAPLAWARSRELIEGDAPHDVSVKWAAGVWEAQERMAAQLAALRELTPWFAAHDVPYVVLKGMPLGQRLYGLPWARPTDDLDLYIPPANHAVALELLLATGWTHFSGEFPGDVVFLKVVDGYPVAVDAHFSLAGPWHRHLPFPGPTVETCSIEGVELRAMGGAFLPVYLAAHLLQHALRPLLWLVDFATIWESLTDAQRTSTMAAAREARLHRVVDAASGWAKDLDALSESSGAVAEEQFIRDALRLSPSHALAQVLWTSASPPDVAKVLSRFIWPGELRGDPASFVKLWTRRVRRVLALSR